MIANSVSYKLWFGNKFDTYIAALNALYSTHFLCFCLSVLRSFISRVMSENMTSKQSKSFMQREDWLVFLTGGLVSSGTLGWLAYREFRTQSLDCKAIMTIAASLAGGMGVYLTGSALVYMLGNSDDEEVKPITSKQEESDSSDQDDYSSLCKKFVDVVTELDRKFEASTAKECKCLNNRIIMNKTQDRTEVSCKNEEMLKRVNDSNQKGSRNGQKLSPDNQKETCSKESIGNRITKFREEIFSYISELKGYVQGTIDPLPSARSIHFVSTEMSDEMRQQVVMAVREYANSMLPKLEQVIDEFVDSVCKAVEVLDYDKKHVKKADEALGVRKDLTEHLNIEMNQYCNALQNAAQKKSLMHSGKKDLCENTLEAYMSPPESVSRPSLQDKDQGDWTKISKHPHRALPKLQIPTSSGTPFMSEETYKHGISANETKNTRPNQTAKLILSPEQMNYLNLLKSEL